MPLKSGVSTSIPAPGEGQPHGAHGGRESGRPRRPEGRHGSTEVSTTEQRRPMRAAASATLTGSSGSGGSGRAVDPPKQ